MSVEILYTLPAELEGLVPSQYPPDQFGAAVNTFMHYRDAPPESLIDGDVATGERATYNGRFSPDEEALGAQIMATGVYNAQPRNIRIQDPEHAALMAASLAALRANPIHVIAPFAHEPESIGPVMDYIMGIVPSDRIHPVDAGIDRASTLEAESRGVPVLNQSQIFKHVDFELLERAGIIPSSNIKGSKGMTMFAGMLALEAAGELEGQYVAFHDTDIVNPGPPANSETTQGEDYRALEHLAMPFAYPVGDINGVMMGRTGDGRNNQSWFGENGHHLESLNPLVQELSHHVATCVWALAGERIIRGDILRYLPWPTDMNVETLLNVAMAGVDVRTGTRTLMQVMNPNQKRENRVSTMPREWGMIYGCERGLRSFYETVGHTDRLPHEWDPDDVGLHNMFYGDKSSKAYTLTEQLHQPHTFVRVQRGILLPSIADMVSMGAVDLDGIRQATSNPN